MNSPRNISLIFVLLLALGGALAGLAFARSAAEPPKSTVSSASAPSSELQNQWTIEGERRYRANCGRCHQPPHKFPPRVMAMAIRHMRVRAMLTDEDMKYVLYYMAH
jgi:mono/diheme cytochrome c family protein